MKGYAEMPFEAGGKIDLCQTDGSPLCKIRIVKPIAVVAWGLEHPINGYLKEFFVCETLAFDMLNDKTAVILV